MSQLTPVNANKIQSIGIDDAATWYSELVAFSQKILKTDLDYGIIPGVRKPSLLKPGAEKLRLVYKLQAKTKCIEKIIDWDRHYIDFTYKTTVYAQDGKSVLAQVEGNCNNYESKFRYTWLKKENVPNSVNIEELQTRSTKIQEFEFAINKAETSGQWGKPQEYWDRWKEAITNGTATKTTKLTSKGKQMPAYEMGDTLYRVPNPDWLSLKNTIMKMAQKRSYVGAVMSATGASEFFTQDIEDMDIQDITGQDSGAVQTPTTQEVPVNPVLADQPTTQPTTNGDGGRVVSASSQAHGVAQPQQTPAPPLPKQQSAEFLPPEEVQQIKNQSTEPLPWENNKVPMSPSEPIDAALLNIPQDDGGDRASTPQVMIVGELVKAGKLNLPIHEVSKLSFLQAQSIIKQHNENK